MSVGLTRSRLVAVRLLALLTIALGVNYVAWRWLTGVNWAAGWIAVPLLLAETATLLDSSLLGVTMWRATERTPLPPDPRATVDVIVSADGEPAAVVLATARAALRIARPHRTWILDDQERPELRRAARSARIGYLARLQRHPDGPRAPSATDLDRALFATEGEFLLVLAAGVVPEPTVLDRTLGYFRDPDVAIVQIPRSPLDPVGGSPVFAGPIQQGKDGWNAAFCCAATAVLRREALIQLGVASCVKPADRTVRRVLRTAERVLLNARDEAKYYGPGVLAALDQVEAAVDEARRDLRTAGRRTSMAEITYRFRMRVTTASRGLVDADVVALPAELAEFAELAASNPAAGWNATPVVPLLDSSWLAWLSRQEMSPWRAMASVRVLVEALDITRVNRVARPLRPPLETLPVTEDVATAMRLHAMGWRSVYHPEALVHDPPTDLDTALRQRQRRAAVTLQVLLVESPLAKRGLSVGQRIVHLAALGGYVAGFGALAYLAAPVLFLGFGVRALTDYGPELLLRLLPYLLASQVLAMVASRSWYGGWTRFADFPTWIRASAAAVANVVFSRPFDPDGVGSARHTARRPDQLAWPQLTAATLLVAAVTVGVGRYLIGGGDRFALVGNLGWALGELLVLAAFRATAARRAAAR